MREKIGLANLFHTLRFKVEAAGHVRHCGVQTPSLPLNTPYYTPLYSALYNPPLRGLDYSSHDCPKRKKIPKLIGTKHVWHARILKGQLLKKCGIGSCCTFLGHCRDFADAYSPNPKPKALNPIVEGTFHEWGTQIYGLKSLNPYQVASLKRTDFGKPPYILQLTGPQARVGPPSVSSMRSSACAASASPA